MNVIVLFDTFIVWGLFVKNQLFVVFLGQLFLDYSKNST